MKKTTFACLFACFTLLGICAGCSSNTSTDHARVHIIFDTDMAPDYDDVGALALLHSYADEGAVEILGTIASNQWPTAAPTIEVINTYFGRPDIPVAAVKGDGPSQNTWHKEPKWTEELPKRYPHTLKSSADAPDALATYRQLLSQQPDQSVTIVTVGFFSNLKNLLASGPDPYSPLSGKELVAQKVKLLVSMAGGVPEGREFNVYIDAKASQYIFTEWPTPIILSGFEIGDKVRTGRRLVESGVQGSPIVDAYTMCLAQDNPAGRQSWDQTVTLVAAQGAEPFFTLVRGTMHVADDGSNTWTDDPKGQHAYLVFKKTPEEVTTFIENRMMHQPKVK